MCLREVASFVSYQSKYITKDYINFGEHYREVSRSTINGKMIFKKKITFLTISVHDHIIYFKEGLGPNLLARLTITFLVFLVLFLCLKIKLGFE